MAGIPQFFTKLKSFCNAMVKNLNNKFFMKLFSRNLSSKWIILLDSIYSFPWIFYSTPIFLMAHPFAYVGSCAMRSHTTGLREWVSRQDRCRKTFFPLFFFLVAWPPPHNASEWFTAFYDFSVVWSWVKYPVLLAIHNHLHSYLNNNVRKLLKFSGLPPPCSCASG